METCAHFKRMFAVIMASLVISPYLALSKAGSSESLVFDPNTATASLFDGTSLGQWKPTGFFQPGRVWIREGAIVLESGHNLTGVTWTGPLVRMDYEISLQAKRIAGRDFFCGLTFPVDLEYCSLICGGWGGCMVSFIEDPVVIFNLEA